MSVCIMGLYRSICLRKATSLCEEDCDQYHILTSWLIYFIRTFPFSFIRFFLFLCCPLSSFTFTSLYSLEFIFLFHPFFPPSPCCFSHFINVLCGGNRDFQLKYYYILKFKDYFGGLVVGGKLLNWS